MNKYIHRRDLITGEPNQRVGKLSSVYPRKVVSDVGERYD